jgi:hypothetical protein
VAAACRSCDAPIIWADTVTGSRMPLDAEPIGKAILIEETIGGGVNAYVKDTYRTHFDTCPNADEHRKPKT